VLFVGLHVSEQLKFLPLGCYRLLVTIGTYVTIVGIPIFSFLTKTGRHKHGRVAMCNAY